MGLDIPGVDDREYTKVAAPPTFEAPEPYGKLPTPTLVIRKYGESWERPFVVVYEPFSGGPGNHTVRSVDKLEQDGLYKGLRIVSRTNSGQIIQYVITQSKGEVYSNEDLGIQLEGSFAVITLDGNGQLQDMYMGEGKSLTYREITLKPESPGSSCAYKRY